jgi:hypothetical protein
VRDKYGPYAEALQHVLQHIEGHYTRGYGDRTTKARAEITLLPGAIEAARAFLQSDALAEQHLDRVTDLIAGFESPYGMELLSTVHWLSKEFPEIADNRQLAVAKVRKWSARKAALFKEEDILMAWERLHDGGWFTTSPLLN